MNPGDIVGNYLLVERLGEWRNHRGSKMILLPIKKQTESYNAVIYHIWSSIDIQTGKRQNIRVPEYTYLDEDDSTSNLERKTIDVDDSNEVTSLLDHYDCWDTGNRNGKNFHLELINLKHTRECRDLMLLEHKVSNKTLKIGIRLKLIQKKNPNSITKRALQEWKSQNSELWDYIVNEIYKK